LGVGRGMRVQGGVIDTGRRSSNFAVVGRRVEIYYVESGLKEVDAGDERLSLDTVFV